jgi:hypothetical protein
MKFLRILPETCASSYQIGGLGVVIYPEHALG